MGAGVEEDGGDEEEDGAGEPEGCGEEILVGSVDCEAGTGDLLRGSVVVYRVVAWGGQKRLGMFLVWSAHGGLKVC